MIKYNILYYIHYTPIPLCGLPLTPASSSQTSAGCPIIQLNDDTIYEEIASDPTG